MQDTITDIEDDDVMDLLIALRTAYRHEHSFSMATFGLYKFKENYPALYEKDKSVNRMCVGMEQAVRYTTNVKSEDFQESKDIMSIFNRLKLIVDKGDVATDVTVAVEDLRSIHLEFTEGYLQDVHRLGLGKLLAKIIDLISIVIDKLN